MELVLYFLMNLAKAIVFGVEIAMLIRAIMSWFPFGDDNGIAVFVYAITEPFIIPVRNILERFEFVRNSPLDISFFVTALILAIIWEIL